MKLLSLAIICTMFSANLAAKTKLIERTEEYAIKSTNIHNIISQIENTPNITVQDDLFHGLMRWKTSWKYSHKSQGRKCRIKKINMQLAVRYKLPVLSEPLINPEHQKKWQIYLNALKKHQEGHKDVALEVTETLKKQLKKIRGHSSCQELDDMISAFSEEELAKKQALHSNYDQSTGFGTKQGADLVELFSAK